MAEQDRLQCHYGAPVTSHSEIVSSLDSGAEEPGIIACEPEGYDPIGSAPISVHKILPSEGGDDPTTFSDLSPDEIHSILVNALHAQENVNTASDDAMLQREAQIELQKDTGEPFSTDDMHDPDAASSGDDVHLPPTSTEPNTPAAREVDDSATSVAPTEAVNPAYPMSPPPTKVPRAGTASEARKFFTGSVIKRLTSPTLWLMITSHRL